jgi:hypothetical protein
MKVRAHLTETGMVSGKQLIHPIPALELWKQLTNQQQKNLAKNWAQLVRRMQHSLETNREVQNVED